MTTDDESSTKEEPESEPGTFVINGEEFTAKEFTEITTRTGDACDVDFCQHCGLAYNPAEQGWYVDRNDIGPDADGETARLFREDALKGRSETEWAGFTEEDVGAWCDSCSWVIQRKRTQRVALADGGKPQNRNASPDLPTEIAELNQQVDAVMDWMHFDPDGGKTVSLVVRDEDDEIVGESYPQPVSAVYALTRVTRDPGTPSEYEVHQEAAPEWVTWQYCDPPVDHFVNGLRCTSCGESTQFLQKTPDTVGPSEWGHL